MVREATIKPQLDPAGYLRRIPLQPHQLIERVTPIADTIVLCHLGVPILSTGGWSLTIGGLVDKPMRLSFSDLLNRRAIEVETVHQCAGSPLEPTTPTRRVCAVKWRGSPLADILDECGVMAEARYIWSTGSDWGSFGGQDCDAYVKDLPLERVAEDVLLAYEMNGEPLRPESGFPVRLVVPGFYGTNSVKWLSRIELTDRRAASPFTTIWYNDPVRDEAGNEIGRKPVWRIMPEAVIVSPAPDAQLRRDTAYEVWGWAWADGGVKNVLLSTDGGLFWNKADLESPAGRSWQKFKYRFSPRERGECEIVCRASGFDGAIQPLEGARNAVHRIKIRVE